MANGGEQFEMSQNSDILVIADNRVQMHHLEPTASSMRVINVRVGPWLSINIESKNRTVNGPKTWFSERKLLKGVSHVFLYFLFYLPMENVL